MGGQIVEHWIRWIFCPAQTINVVTSSCFTLEWPYISLAVYLLASSHTHAHADNMYYKCTSRAQSQSYGTEKLYLSNEILSIKILGWNELNEKIRHLRHARIINNNIIQI